MSKISSFPLAIAIGGTADFLEIAHYVGGPGSGYISLKATPQQIFSALFSIGLFEKNSFTLAANALSTVVTDPNCTVNSLVLPIAATQHAAPDPASGVFYIVPGNGQFTVHHASNGYTDRRFNYLLAS